jgi:hypothetical protein
MGSITLDRRVAWRQAGPRTTPRGARFHVGSPDSGTNESAGRRADSLHHR